MSDWNGSPRFFLQENGRTHTRAWNITVVGPHVDTSWGVFGGAMQNARETHVGVNHGKANYISPEAYALDRASEQIRKKRREGYREFDAAGKAIDAVTPVSFDFDRLPNNLCFYKPDNSMGAGMLKKAEAGKVRYSRKRNGLAHIMSRGKADPKIYSRTMLRQHDLELGSQYTWDDRFPHLIKGVKPFLPPNSILLGELVMNRGGKDDFKHVQSISKGLTPKALADQESGGWLSFYIWDVAFWNGENLLETMEVEDRYAIIHEQEIDSPYILPVEAFGADIFPKPEDALNYAKAMKWEGFVVVDPAGVYGDKGMNYKGKPDRPGKYCAKLKPSYEDDFIVYWDPEKGYGERSTKGRSNQGIASVALYQKNSKGETVFISNLSSGLTEDMKKDLARTDVWPQVWEVEYDDRTYMSNGDDTNALTFARFIRVRDDKKPDECVNVEL